MESHAQSVEDNLIDSLSFKLKPGASYVTDRRSVTYFPQGGNSYSSTGVKVIKILLTGDQWLDPSTVKIQFRFTNDHSTDALVPFTVGAHGFFRRFRLICGGQIVEDVGIRPSGILTAYGGTPRSEKHVRVPARHFMLHAMAVTKLTDPSHFGHV